MSKFSSTTFGKISGKHGTAVASTREGKSILRVYTPPSNPNTDAQQSQRIKFGLVAVSLNPLRNIIYYGFGGTNGYSQAYSLALRNAITGTYPAFSINYAKVMLSSGSLPQSPSVNVTKGAGTDVTVEWDVSVWTNGSPDDLVHICFLNDSTKAVVYSQAQVIRSAGQSAIVLPAVWAGAVIHCWIFFASPGSQKCSVSQYIGTVAL
jgi:hypothetical protein